MRYERRSFVAALAVLLLPAAACSEFTKVTNPGPIQDSDLNNPDVVPALVVGMSGDLSAAIDDMIELTSIAADELAHGGSYAAPGLFYRGIILPEDVNGVWAGAHRARWVAENGILRIREILGEEGYESSAEAARANVLAGYANRLLGENMCYAVIDGGPREDHKVHFSRAEDYFTEGLRLAERVGNATLRYAALAGRASVRAWQGKWDEAAQDAAQVPTNFVYEAIFSENSGRENNNFWIETHVRLEYTVYNTRWANVHGDPRVPWDTLYAPGGGIRNGQDGFTPYFQQKKYPERGSDVPLSKGTEMRVLQAEAALRRGDLTQFTALINEQRGHYGMDPIPQPANEDEAWEVLDFERGAVVWLEVRRFWDLRRWYEEGRNQFLANRDKCIPISRNEMNSNPNLHE